MVFSEYILRHAGLQIRTCIRPGSAITRSLAKSTLIR